VNDYVKEKRAVGYKFEKGAQTLRRIIHLQNDIDRGFPILSEELANQWIEKTAWENETNRSHRISVLRGLGDYMMRMGYNTKAIPRRLAPQRDYAYTPYIFSEHELGLILRAIDRLCENGISRHSDLIFPIVFRILIGCLLRSNKTRRGILCSCLYCAMLGGQSLTIYNMADHFLNIRKSFYLVRSQYDRLAFIPMP